MVRITSALVALVLLTLIAPGRAHAQPGATPVAIAAPCRAATSAYLEGSAWLGTSNAHYDRTRLESAFRISSGVLRDRCGGVSLRLGMALGGFLALNGSPENSGLGQIVLGPELELSVPWSGWRLGVTTAVELSTDYANGVGARSIRLGLRARYGHAMFGIDGIHSTGAGDYPGPVTGVMFGVGATGKPGAVVIGIAGGVGLIALIGLLGAISGGGD